MPNRIKGAKPADLPIEQPSKLQLIDHQPHDRQGLGLTIPPSLLLRADEAIQ